MRYDYNEIYALVTDVPRTSDEIGRRFYNTTWNNNSKKHHINDVLAQLIEDGKVLAFYSNVDGRHARMYVLNKGQTVKDEPTITDQMIEMLKKENRWVKTDELISAFYGSGGCNRRFRHTVNQRLTKAKYKGIESDKFFDVVHWRAVQ